MKLPLKLKKKEKEQKPQKGFEEFAIDPKVLDELDSLDNLPTEKDNDNIVNEKIDVQEKDIEVIDNANKQLIDASNIEFINIVRENVDFCAKEIKEISANMGKIETQKSSESFWKKGENIKTISKYVNKISDVQQKTLDLLVMFLGASGKMADDYDTILKTIDELGELNGGETEVLNYLLKVKKMIKEIKDNDERLKNIIFDVQTLKNDFEKLQNNYNEKIVNFEKNSKINISKIHRLNLRLNRQSFFLLLSFLISIILGIILYIKVF